MKALHNVEVRPLHNTFYVIPENNLKVTSAGIQETIDNPGFPPAWE